MLRTAVAAKIEFRRAAVIKSGGNLGAHGAARSGCTPVMFLAAALLSAAQLSAAAYLEPPAATLRYGADGKFKVLQFADMHFENGLNTTCSEVAKDEEKYCTDMNTTVFLAAALQLEKPDLVVFSGDNIDFGTNSATWAWDLFAKVCKDAGVPFAAVGGNHDQENLQKLTRKQVQQYLGQEPGAKTRMGPDFPENHLNRTESPGQPDNPWGDDGHYGNFYIELQKRDGMAGGTLYILDSGDSSKFAQVGGADWIWDSQNAWFRNVSRGLQAQRSGAVLPASAWFHIPLPEHHDLLVQKVNISGTNGEGVSSASVHSGLFTSFVEAGDVKTASVGHDHVNDYCGNFYGVELCYAGAGLWLIALTARVALSQCTSAWT